MSWKRSAETKRRNKNLYEETKNNYGRGCWYDEEQNRIIRYQMSKKGRGNRAGWRKRVCNRLVRRRKIDMGGSKGGYRKVAEYWWEIF